MKHEGVQRRGAELRRHILAEAKEVFLETGYERASMDTVAARAGTSKRSLYAHFQSKDKLFVAVLDLVRELYLGSLGVPEDYAVEPAEAVTRYCGRFLQLMTWGPQVRTTRLSVTEAERLPASARSYYDAMFAGTYGRLAAFVGARYAMTDADAAACAQDLLARTVLPRLFRTLLNVDAPLAGGPRKDGTRIGDDVDLDAIRRVVAAALPG